MVMMMVVELPYYGKGRKKGKEKGRKGEEEKPPGRTAGGWVVVGGGCGLC